MTSSNGNIFRVTGHLCGEFTSHRWIPLTKANDAELWCFLWSAPWINDWVINGEAGDLTRHRADYDVIVMTKHRIRSFIHVYQESTTARYQANWCMHAASNSIISGTEETEVTPNQYIYIYTYICIYTNQGDFWHVLDFPRQMSNWTIIVQRTIFDSFRYHLWTVKMSSYSWLIQASNPLWKFYSHIYIYTYYR